MGTVWLAARRAASGAEARQLADAARAGWTPAEAARLAALTAPRRRGQYLAGHALLRALLRAPALRARLGGGALQFPADRAPQWTGAAPVRLGIAHSGDWVFAAAADGPLGLDCECHKDRPGWRDLALATCPELFDGAAQPALADFYRAWTLKEAWIKAHGQAALPDALRRLRVRAPVAADALTLTSWPFGAGVLGCLARSGAHCAWPLGQPEGLGLQPPSVWAMDVQKE